MHTLYLIALCCLFIACDSTTPTKQDTASISSESVAPALPATTVANPANITPEQVRKFFEQDVLKRLLAQEEGRQLHTANPYLDKGLRVLVADIDGDGQPEGLVQYQLLAGSDEATLAMPAINGIYIYPSKDGQLQPHQMTRVDVPTTAAYLQQIKDQVWQFKVLEYAKDDPRCCPSITIAKNYQLTKLYAWEPID